MTGWEIFMIVMALCVVLLSASILIYRINPTFCRKVMPCLETDEERAVLTNAEVHPPFAKPRSKETSLTKISEVGHINAGEHSETSSLTKADTISLQDPKPASLIKASPKLNRFGTTEPALVTDTEKLKRGTSTESLESDHYIENADVGSYGVGQLEFTVSYERDLSELMVGVVDCKELKTATCDSNLDSYVKVSTSNTKDLNQVQTQIIRATTSPIFDERFPFRVEPYEMDRANIEFEVYSVDKYARHKVIGEAKVRVGDIEIHHPVKLWVNLRGIDEESHELGDILFSLSYLPTAERLTVVIVKARNLSNKCCDVQNGTNVDPMVKVFVYEDGKRVRKKKTTTRKGTLNPVFNEAMIFPVAPESLSKLEIRVLAGFQIEEGKLKPIGHIAVGPNCSGMELSHWNQMMVSLRKPVAMWHPLKKT